MNLRNKTFNSSGQLSPGAAGLNREKRRTRESGMHHNEIELRGATPLPLFTSPSSSLRTRLKGLSRLDQRSRGLRHIALEQDAK